TIADRCDRAALDRLGSDVTSHQPAGCAGEAPIGEQRHLLPQALADDRRRHLQHLAHARTAGRALVADHDDVARADPPLLNRAEAFLLGLEDPGRTHLLLTLSAGELDHGALGGEVAAQDRQTTFSLERIGQRPHYFLSL